MRGLVIGTALHCSPPLCCPYSCTPPCFVTPSAVSFRRVAEVAKYQVLLDKLAAGDDVFVTVLSAMGIDMILSQPAASSS